MTKSYDDWLYHNICPWCEERYDKVNHTGGCTETKYPLSNRAKKILAFTKILYGEGDTDAATDAG